MKYTSQIRSLLRPADNSALSVTDASTSEWMSETVDPPVLELTEENLKRLDESVKQRRTPSILGRDCLPQATAGASVQVFGQEGGREVGRDVRSVQVPQKGGRAVVTIVTSMRPYHTEVLREFKCAYPVELRQPCASSLLATRVEEKPRRGLYNPQEVISKFSGTTKLVGNSLNCTHPLQAAFGKGFIAKLPTARCGDTAEQLATSKCIICDANHCCRHLDYSKLCHASASTNLMPGSTLTWRGRGTNAKAPSGTISSGFMGIWTASGMSRIGHPSRHSCVGRTSQQSRKTTQYSTLCCSFSQSGFSKQVCLPCTGAGAEPARVPRSGHSAHGVDFDQSLAVFTGPRANIVKIAWETESFDASSGETAIRPCSRLIGSVHGEGDRCP